MDLKVFVACLETSEKESLLELLLVDKDRRNNSTAELHRHNLSKVKLWANERLTPAIIIALAKFYTGWGDRFHPETGVSDYSIGDLRRIRGIGSKGLSKIIEHQNSVGPRLKDF